MTEAFDLFFENIKRRVNHQNSFTSFGEDSIRYDFFNALQVIYKLEPHLFFLEYPFPDSEFIKTKVVKKTGQGRKFEKPEFDLRIDSNGLLNQGIVAEFGFFRNPEIGKIDVSGNIGKLLNESSRLCLLKNSNDYNNHRSLLIIVTDKSMINYGKNKRGPKPDFLISDEMIFNNEVMKKFNKTIKSKLKEGFRLKLNEYDIYPTAKRIYNKQESNKWAIWIWEITPQINNIN